VLRQLHADQLYAVLHIFTAHAARERFVFHLFHNRLRSQIVDASRTHQCSGCDQTRDLITGQQVFVEITDRLSFRKITAMGEDGV
jgi:hypothetical protein